MDLLNQVRVIAQLKSQLFKSEFFKAPSQTKLGFYLFIEIAGFLFWLLGWLHECRLFFCFFIKIIVIKRSILRLNCWRNYQLDDLLNSLKPFLKLCCMRIEEFGCFFSVIQLV